ncbi:MAG TPA: hypothetical protein VHX43_04850 [Xanthobacteraceae bacterium]|jgi:hypothetical protein|nr:hypothetical protein [Xanthobacteraceae bacterium]
MKERRLLACMLAAALAAAVVSPHAATAAARGLCAPDETSVFICRNGSKTASLCLSGGSAHLRYVFGSPGRIELSYPAETVRPQDAFRHGHIMYSGIGGDYLQFDNGGFRYVVFSILGHDTDNRGVVVERGGKSVMNFVCKGASSDDLTTDFFKSMALPEIEDYTNFDVPEVYFRPAR